METPAVSVIIPVWNSGKYFRECLDSVVGQTLRNIEILIVDDASTDGSGAVADEYAARDDRITVLHQKKSTGAGPARNVAIAMAKGEYIAFMDSDDLYPSADVLEILYYKATEQNANICGGSLYKIDEEGYILDKNVPNQFFVKECWYNYSNYQYDGGFYRFIYRNKFLKNNNLIFPDYRRFQDTVFFVRTMVISKKFYAVLNYSYAYRKKNKNIIFSNEMIVDQLKGIIDLLDISKKNRLYYLHYIISKNLLDTVNYKIKKNRLKYFFYVYKSLIRIDSNILKYENKIRRVKISIIKIILRYLL